jgi:hypothetical protein
MSAAMVTAAQRFEQAKAAPEAARQESLRAATAAYTKAREEQLTEWRARLALAREAFEAVKEDPDHPEHNMRRDAATRLEIQPSSKPLRDKLDADIRAIDRQYQESIAALRRQFGIKPLA